MRLLIVGLGNPSRQYKHTRHNMGAQIVRSYAYKKGIPLTPSPKFSGELGKRSDLILLLPSTYMNFSGKSVKKTVDFFTLPLQNTLVVSDDISIPFQSLRFRHEGGTGGHNGLKSIAQELETHSFPRLRAGIGDRTRGSLEDHVLGIWSQEEAALLPGFLEDACREIERWINAKRIS
ncbi:MAG: aminoacyl-tRNA hydrolase [Chlamydiota bacterium]|nr:aminoacyl-tRNA hydrolase [Chlamydiota bacterium]